METSKNSNSSVAGGVCADTDVAACISPNVSGGVNDGVSAGLILDVSTSRRFSASLEA